MTKLKITVTKEILERSKNCYSGPFSKLPASENCAIALAVRDIFPNAAVSQESIYTFTHNRDKIDLPFEATEFIALFDTTDPNERTGLPEISFEIEIPDHIIESINIDELRPLLTNHPTLQLV